MAKKKRRFPFLAETIIGILLLVGMIFVLAKIRLVQPREVSPSAAGEETVLVEDLPVLEIEFNVDSDAQASDVSAERKTPPPAEGPAPETSTESPSAPLTAMELVERYFEAYNNRAFRRACAMLTNRKCDPQSRAGVARFAEEYDKLVDGYDEVYVWVPSIPDEFHSEVVCVQYEYQYKNDPNTKTVQEVMSYYIRPREDGYHEITARVCEQKLLNGTEEVDCPLIATRRFCVD